ncbi:MAG: SulP family inorganic anion transporter, partial [Chloroflexota bacterium]|nr:SulP family inorganic anion transporter [Chloroflexota bacterium]
MTEKTNSKSVSFFTKFATTLMAGALTGVIAVSNAFSYGATIFSGDLSEHLAAGVGLVLFGGFVVTFILALTSSIKGAIATPKAATIPILAVIAAGIAADMSISATPDEVFLTITVAFAIGTLVVGLIFLLFGLFKMGSLIRFMPYPIFGGFLAGLGWLLIRGGLGVMVDLPLETTSFSQWIESPNLIYWLPGVVFAFILLTLQRRF